MADDPLSAALSEIRDRHARVVRRQGHAAAWIEETRVLAEESVPLLLAAVDAVLKLHSPRSDRVLGSSCFAHRHALNTMLPVRECENCVQDRQREVCPECRDEYGDPVMFQDCRARKAILAGLTGKDDGR